MSRPPSPTTPTGRPAPAIGVGDRGLGRRHRLPRQPALRRRDRAPARRRDGDQPDEPRALARARRQAGRASTSPRWRWTRCRASPGRSRSTCSARWRTSPATARSSRRRTCSAASSPARSRPPARCRRPRCSSRASASPGSRPSARPSSLGAIVRATDPRPEVADQVQVDWAGSTWRSSRPRSRSAPRATPRRWATTTRRARRSSTPSRPRTSTSSSPRRSSPAGRRRA